MQKTLWLTPRICFERGGHREVAILCVSSSSMGKVTTFLVGDSKGQEKLACRAPFSIRFNIGSSARWELLRPLML